ncbi:hypothetical protein ALC56_13689 [Trachymyrmex septentrionalis]|uniref:Uncharacterized protein n=2 Tax=Trachymyrmex septentrionalis TaxID=34720 RepID=A0A195EUV6_9HYME|nr:PREDICTED: uncharacterized protein LOC108754891 isoform X2 [Trachymyrmex septentrionalis]XP_018353052.1 PREDICTED: uncharacterized protein LOC108754891 isoform X2 [Trachymyrmex septentrionalis]KYN31936.1 hypothetical protein ALC56_13689 [Trachymyrmex septentrionalis]
MSLCPSSSHQLVAAAIAFRRARRKFPKDFGLESTVERASGNTKTQEITTSREGPINQVRSSSMLVRRAHNSGSDHVCPASVRNHDSGYDRSYNKENSISCSCYRTRNVGEDVSELRDECNGGDAVDTVPSREREEFASSDADRKNEFVKLIDRDRCDVASRSIERIPQSSHPASYRHCKARCPSRPRSNMDPNVNPPCDSAPCEKYDEVACGDFTGDRSKGFAPTSCHGTSIDLGGNAEEDIVTSDTRGHSSDVEDMWTRTNTLTKCHSTHRKIADSTWRCQCEYHPREDSIRNLPRSSCDRCRDECYHRRHNYRCDRSHRHCCCPQRDCLCINIKGCENGISGEKAQHKSWRDQMRGENSRLYARQCYSKEYSGIIPASRERNDEERKEKKNDDDDDDNDEDEDEDEDEDDDDSVVVINHKDSMCILAEKYKASRKWRGRRCGDRAQSGDRTGNKDECNKSLTSEIIDQPGSSLEIANAVSHEGPRMRHSCQGAHCENCGTGAIARIRGRVCGRHEPPEGEFDRLKPPLNETAATRCSSSRPPCRRVF